MWREYAVRPLGSVRQRTHRVFHRTQSDVRYSTRSVCSSAVSSRWRAIVVRHYVLQRRRAAVVEIRRMLPECRAAASCDMPCSPCARRTLHRCPSPRVCAACRCCCPCRSHRRGSSRRSDRTRTRPRAAPSASKLPAAAAASAGCAGRRAARELGADQVGRVPDVDAEPRIGEVALPVHLGDGDVGIPVGDRPLRRVGLVLDLGEPIRRREDQRRVLPVLVVARIVFARAPRRVHRLLCPAVSAGDSAMIAPTLRSRFGQPSLR